MPTPTDPVLYGPNENRRLGWGLIGASVAVETALLALLVVATRNGWLRPQPLEVYLLVVFSVPFVCSILNAWLSNGLVYSLGIGSTPALLFVALDVLATLRGGYGADGPARLPILLILGTLGAMVSMIGFVFGMLGRSVVGREP